MMKATGSIISMMFLLLCAMCAAIAIPHAAYAEGGIDPADPMVRVTSPPGVDLDIDAVLAAVSKDVSKKTGIKESFITYYWQTFDTVIYEGKQTKKPLFVDLYVPAFLSQEDIEGVINAVADGLVEHAGAERKWIFIHTHYPLDGQVYIGGEIQRWDTDKDESAETPRDISDRAPGKFLFNDKAFAFQSLWRFGLTATGGSDLGELLTITGQVEDFDKKSWYGPWNAMARKLLAEGDSFATAGHAQSAKEAYFRATNYFRSSEIFLPQDDPRKFQAWENGRGAFLKAAALTGGNIEPVRIPYGKTTLPGYLVKAGRKGKKKPLLIIQTGLDGTAEDLYFILGAQAAKHGFNCLIFEGPGQGEAIHVHKLPFRHDWEKVLTPVVDFALTLPETDPDQLAVIGYSMGGYLVPRALAFEKRIRWGIVDGGVINSYEGVMSKFPKEVREGVGVSKRKDRVNQVTYEEMKKHPELSQFINQMLWTFKAETPYDLFVKLKKFDLGDLPGKIEAEMLVLNSSNDQVAGSNAQSKKFYNALKSKKTYYEFTPEYGAQFHCQLGAPLVSSERIMNWLSDQVNK
ncbi:MAG: alpha/beta hydrolase [Desulfovibrionaceae bacterium]